MKQFLLPKNLDDSGSVTLGGRDFRYLVQVRRMKVNDSLSVCGLDGLCLSMCVAAIDEAKKTITLMHVSDPVAESVAFARSGFSSARVWLFQWLTKNAKFDTIVRQATETGVEAVVPVIGEHCIPDGAGYAKQERWQRIVREARQQSGSPIQTCVYEPCTIHAALSLWESARATTTAESLALMLCEKQHQDSECKMSAIKKPSLIALAVGAEGGISHIESILLQKYLFKPLHFDTNVLRAETAALYAVAAVQTALMECFSWHENV